MARVGSFRALLAVQSKRFDAVIGDTTKTLHLLGELLEDDARKLLSGKTTAQDLKRMGHPFGRGASASANLPNAGNVGQRGSKRRGTKRAVPLRPVNVQSGRLLASLAGRSVRPGRFDLDIGRGVRYARYILHPAGTKLMVGRGVMGWRQINKGFPIGELERRHRGRNRALYDAVKRGHRKVP